MLASRIVLPNIQVPVPVAVHPQVAALEDGTIEFLRRHEFVGSAERESELRAARFGKLAALTLPYGDIELVQIQSDIVALLFLTDDSEIEQPALAGNLWRVADHCLTSVRAIRHSDIDPGLGKYRALVELVQRLDSAMAPRQVDRFINTLIEQYLASACEAMYLAQGVIPSIDNYTTLRLATNWSLGIEFFIEASGNCELDDSLRLRPEVLELRASITQLLGYSQDLLTGVREVERCTTFNMPMVFARDSGLSLQQSFDHLAELLNAEWQRFTILSERLLASRGHRSVRRWLQGWAHWASGHHAWCLESGRYDSQWPK
jgi:hypothetical protein